jgi:hypothetical protein
MSDTYKCAWCGRHFEPKGVSKFMSGATVGISDLGKKYCSKACKHAAEEAKNGPKTTSNESSTPTGANASGGENVTVVNKGDGFGASVAKGFFGMTNNMVEEGRKGMKEQETKVENQITEVSTMTFGTTADEISNQLNQLVSMASAKPEKKVKNAIVEKLEFGILKLKQLNALAEADFFEKKLVPLKKKSWF